MADDESNAPEEWRAIPGIPNYEASSWGRIRSLDRFSTFVTRWGTPTSRFHKGKVLSLKLKHNGCGVIYDCFYAYGKYPQVNRAVCEAFHGAPPSARHEAAHLDGNSRNNRPLNLVWATPSENAGHKVLHGTAPIGEGNGCSRLADDDIPRIFSECAGGRVYSEIAAMFGVSISSISLVIRRGIWTHIPINDELVREAQVMAKSNIGLARQRSNAKRREAARGRA